MSTTTLVASLPVCDLCGAPNAYADAQIPAYSTWGNVCRPCFKRHGCSLGTGRGQELVLAASATALDVVADPAFDAWMAKVNKACEFYIACDTTELADFGLDFDYAACHAEGLTPGVTAARAIAAAAKEGF